VNFVLRSTLALIVLAFVPALVSRTQTKASPATSFPKVVASVPKPVSKAGEPVEVIATQVRGNGFLFGPGRLSPDLSKKDTKFPVLQSTVRGAPVQVELTE